MRISLLRALVAATLLSGSVTQAQTAPVTIGERTTLKSAVLGEERPVLVHLPRNYAGDRRARYPVVYLLDGDAHFASVSAMADFLAQNGRAPEMIVVAIPNTRDRTHDLTPPVGVKTAIAASRTDTTPNPFPTAGGAAAMRTFITNELARWVERTYRTVPYRVLVGHSFGGLFAIDALASTPNAFNAYVVISPSLWWDNRAYEKRMETVLASITLDNLSVYMTTGSAEGADMIDPARALGASLAAVRAPGFRSWYVVNPNESHGSNPFRTTYDAFERIYEGWAPNDSMMRAAVEQGDVANVDAHYAMLTKRFGYTLTTPVEIINQVAYANLRSKKFDAALALFRRNTEQSPDYANGWDSLADGLEAQGNVREAIVAQERAVKVGTAQRDPALAAYLAHLARLKAAR